MSWFSLFSADPLQRMRCAERSCSIPATAITRTLATAEFFRALGYEKEIQTGELDFQLVKQTTEWR